MAIFVGNEALADLTIKFQRLTNGEATTISLATTAQGLIKNDYLYVTLTSDNADAVDGTGGVLTIAYNILSLNK